MPEQPFGVAYGQAAYLKKQQADYYQQLLAESQAAYPEGGYGEMEPFGGFPGENQGVQRSDPGLTNERFRSAVQDAANQQARVQPGIDQQAGLFGNPTAIRSQLAYGQEPSIPGAYGPQTFDQGAADQALMEGYQAGKGLSNADFDRLFTTTQGTPDTSTTEFETPAQQRSLAGDRSVSKVTNAKVTSVPGTPGSVVPRSSVATPDAMQGEPAPAWNQYLSDVRASMFSEAQKKQAGTQAQKERQAQMSAREKEAFDKYGLSPEELAKKDTYNASMLPENRGQITSGGVKVKVDSQERLAAMAGFPPDNTARNDELRRSLLAQSKSIGRGMHG